MIVFFDIDNQLINTKAAHPKAIGGICHEYGLFEKYSDQNLQKWLTITNH